MKILKNRNYLTLVMMILLLSLAACSSGETGDDNKANGKNPSQGDKTAKENITIDMSLFYTENDAFNDSFKIWADRVNEETEGRVTFNPYHSASLVSLFDTLDAVTNGSVDAGVLSAGAISGQIPAMGLLEIIGIFQEEEQFKAMYEEASPIMEEIFEKEGVKLLFWSPGGTDGLILHQKEFITKTDQFKGLKMRTAGRWQSEQIQKLGASPVSMDPSELYLALQNSTIDSTIQSVNLANSQKLFEVTPKMVSIGSGMNVTPYVINPDVWAEISPKDQEIIEKVSLEVGLETYDDIKTKEEEDLQNMENEGAELYKLTDEEKNELLKVFHSVWEEIADSAGEDGQKLLEVLKRNELE